MFDPNSPMPMGGDQFAQQQLEVAQQRKLAELLRQQAMSQGQPQGQMIGQGPGAQFVPPHFLQQLAPVFGQANAAWQDARAKQAEQTYNEQTGAHAQQWRAGLPRAVEARPELPGPQAEGGSPELLAQAAQPVTREAILKHTLEGLKNPRLRDEAMLVNQGLTADLTRTEDKAFRDEQARLAAKERADSLAATLEARRMELADRLADRALDRASREALQKQHDAVLREMNTANVEARRYTAELAKQGGMREDSREFRQDVEKLSRRAEPIVPMIKSAQLVQDMIQKYTDPKTGKVKDIPGVGFLEGSLPNALLSTEGSTARQQVQMFANAMIRAQAGLSQTLSETERATLELLANGRFRQDQFIAAWPNLMEKVNSTAKAIEAGYHPSVIQKFNERGGGLTQVGAPAGLTPAEQAELDALRKAVPGAAK